MYLVQGPTYNLHVLNSGNADDFSRSALDLCALVDAQQLTECSTKISLNFELWDCVLYHTTKGDPFRYPYSALLSSQRPPGDHLVPIIINGSFPCPTSLFQSLHSPFEETHNATVKRMVDEAHRSRITKEA